MISYTKFPDRSGSFLVGFRTDPFVGPERSDGASVDRASTACAGPGARLSARAEFAAKYRPSTFTAAKNRASRLIDALEEITVVMPCCYVSIGSCDRIDLGTS